DRTLASTLPDDAEPALAEDVGATTELEPEEATPEGIAVASLNEDLADGLSEEDAAVLDALRDPLPAPQAPEELDAAAMDARYAVTGIWPKAPHVPEAPALIPLEDFYLTSIDPVSPALDAGDPSNTEPVDQRGEPRLAGLGDIGSVEALPVGLGDPIPGCVGAPNSTGAIGRTRTAGSLDVS
ncbi:MAG: choice-of-anchor Q domain-containing protein, partial [Bacteroidota bacterium]